MGTWIMLWKDGNVTAVTAPSKVDAIDYLENIGPVDASRMETFSRGFSVTFTPGENGRWDNTSMSSGLRHELDVAYAELLRKRARCRTKS